MEPLGAAHELERSGRAIRAFVDGMPIEAARWKPSPDRWSILEVVNHLWDEERDDFRRRIDGLLNLRGTPWPRIDPEGWCRERRYQERDLRESVEGFAAERGQSLRWLRGLRGFDPALADPAQAVLHPRLAELRAGDLLTAWVAHDLLHLRQMLRLSFQRLEQTAAPYGTDYAGSW